MGSSFANVQPEPREVSGCQKHFAGRAEADRGAGFQLGEAEAASPPWERPGSSSGFLWLLPCRERWSDLGDSPVTPGLKHTLITDSNLVEASETKENPQNNNSTSARRSKYTMAFPRDLMRPGVIFDIKELLILSFYGDKSMFIFRSIPFLDRHGIFAGEMTGCMELV